MCTVSITVNEEAIRRINPSLTSKEAIGQWLQRQVDIMLEDLSDIAEEPPCCYTREEVRQLVTDRLDRLDAGMAKTISHEEVKRRMKELLS